MLNQADRLAFNGKDIMRLQARIRSGERLTVPRPTREAVANMRRTATDCVCSAVAFSITCRLPPANLFAGIGPRPPTANAPPTKLGGATPALLDRTAPARRPCPTTARPASDSAMLYWAVRCARPLSTTADEGAAGSCGRFCASTPTWNKSLPFSTRLPEGLRSVSANPLPRRWRIPLRLPFRGSFGGTGLKCSRRAEAGAGAVRW
eukprot:SAG31_NODE_3934_length_3737_cov_14.336998_3_plen_206_part_00